MGLKLLKLPICPHCKAVYRYNEVNNMCKYKNIECRNCQKPFTVYKAKGRAILSAIVAVILIILDILLVHFCEFNLIGIIIFTAVCLALAMLLLPFTVRFKKYSEDDKNKTHNKK